jgi:LysR family nitrogen assimilation transcriptional regulator
VHPVRSVQEAIINLRQLRYFVRIVEAGSITRAAHRLYVAQPALGSQMRLLEEELGVTLLERHSRGIRTTPAGDLLYQRALPILQNLESARQDVMALGGVQPESLVLGVTPGIANVLGSGLLMHAREAVPSVHLSLVEEMSYALADAVERGDIDLALGYEASDRPGLRCLELLREELLFVVSRQAYPGMPGLGEASITLAQAVSHPLVLAEGRDPLRKLVEAQARSLGCPFNLVFEASSISTMKAIVAQGGAASIQPRGTVIAELRSGEFEMRRIVDPVMCRVMYLIEHAGRRPLRAEKAVRRFIAAMVDRFVLEQGDLIHSPQTVALD